MDERVVICDRRIGFLAEIKKMFETMFIPLDKQDG
jgi:hypothetical protein